LTKLEKELADKPWQQVREHLRVLRQREGRYLLRTNLSADNPESLWRCYMHLVFVEEAFRTLKGDLGLRPIYHHQADRIEAHLFVAFLAMAWASRCGNASRPWPAA
jgi:transposase